MTVLPGVLTLSQVKVCELSRNKQKAVLFTNPLGKACYELNQERVKACLDELDRFRLLEPGLVYASEVRHAAESRPLNAKEWRSFQAEIGCQPLHLACLACGSEVERLLKEGAKDKAKVVQQLAADIVKLLIEYGARLDLADVGPMENTALHLAARAGAAHLLSILLVLGADCRAVNGDGCTAELLAQRAGQTLCQQILQVMLVEKELDFLDGPKQGRSLRPRSRNSKGSTAPAPPEATPAEGAAPRAREAEGAKYGRDGLWAMLHPDSERSSESDGVDSSDFSACSDASDYEDQTRNLVRKLRIRKARRTEQLQEIQAEHEALQEDAQRLEEMAMSLKDRFKTLTDRLARFDAGDLASTQEEIASERELRSWWEQRSGDLATQVAQLLEQRKRQREEKSQEIYRLEREMRYHQRRVQGLESYWEQFFEAECAAGVIDLLSAEQRCRSLEKELKKMVTDISPDLATPSALPQLFSPVSPSSGSTLGAARVRKPLAPSRELCAAAAVHRKIHMVEMEHKAKVNEMTDFCNGRFAEKERHIMAALEEKLGEMVRGPLEEQNVSWVTIAQMIETARARLAAQTDSG